MKKIIWRLQVLQRLAFTAVLIMAVLGASGCDRIKEARTSVENRKNQGTEQDGEKTVSEETKKEKEKRPVKGTVSTQVFAVNTIPASQGQIRDYLALSGDILASSTVDTYSDAAGKVSMLYVSVGSRVAKGAPVAAVDPSRPGMEFVASIVRAPVSGTVVALPAQVGMTISQAVPLARISGEGGLEIQLHVAERFISRVAMNQPCEITLDAWPGEIFRGTVTELSPTVDVTSRTMEIRVGVENPGAKLKAGMFAQVRLITEEKQNVVKIPVAAVVTRFGEQFVFVEDSSDSSAAVAKKRLIVQGISIDGVLEVTEGLESGENIIVRGQTLLADGSLINVIERLAPIRE